MNDLTRREQVLLFERERRIGEHEIGAGRFPPPHELRDQHDGDGDAPDVLSLRDDEEIEIAVALEIQVRDAARQRHHARRTAARKSPTARGGGGRGKSGSVLRGAAVRRSDRGGRAGRRNPGDARSMARSASLPRIQRLDFAGGLRRFDQRLTQLRQRQRVVEQRRVQDAARNRRAPPRSSTRVACAGCRK